MVVPMYNEEDAVGPLVRPGCPGLETADGA
jgi:hypothetical protein